MYTFQLPAAATVSLQRGSSVLMKPASYIEGEPLVTYTILDGAVSFIIPLRAVNGDNFLTTQLRQTTMDVEQTAEGFNVKLDAPLFRDPCAFPLVLDFLNRRLDRPATLRQTGTQLTTAQWVSLVEIEKFIFYKTDRNPIWSGLTSQDFRVNGTVTQTFIFRPVFNLALRPDLISVAGPGGFMLKLNMTSITNPLTRPKSLLEGDHFGSYMEYPFEIDNKTSFFIPHSNIQCMIEGVYTACEGVLHSNCYIRIEPIDAEAFHWFMFEITPRMLHSDSVVYGAIEQAT